MPACLWGTDGSVPEVDGADVSLNGVAGGGHLLAAGPRALEHGAGGALQGKGTRLAHVEGERSASGGWRGRRGLASGSSPRPLQMRNRHRVAALAGASQS